MACCVLLLLLFCLKIAVLKCEDYFTLGQQNVANVDFSEMKFENRLFSLGKVKEDGYIVSICARGLVSTNKRAILLFYIIRETKGMVKVEHTFNVIIYNRSRICKTEFDIQHAPKKNDIIAVYVGNNTLKREGFFFEPIKISFTRNNSDLEYISGSDNLNIQNNTSVYTINSKVNILIRGQHLHENMILAKNELNVQVKLKSSRKSSTLLILVIVSGCIISILLAASVLLVVKLFKRSFPIFDKTIRLSEISSAEMHNNNEESTTKDFSDVQYLLQKDSKQAVINITHYHGSKSRETSSKQERFHSLLTNHKDAACDSTVFQDHDYDEPYFEPACTEETCLKQLKTMGVPLIAKERLKLYSGDVLGRGAFGSVHRGVLYSVLEFNKLTEEVVAVKTLEDTTSEEDRVKFLQEAAIMGQFSHPNIIKTLGIVISPDSCKLVIEIMSHGDLQNHLHTINPYDLEQELAPTLLSYSRHVANGMMYLAVKSFVHRDLAARNVLVAEDGVCKIADFGLSRKLQDEDYYVSHGGKIPVKWTAPEALHYHKYSTASDVWSYGCVLYEIWSLGQKPYHDLNNEQIIEKLSSGFRLPPPPGCPREVYQLMILCWHSDPMQRPSFVDITAQLQKPDYQVLKWKEDSQVSSEATVIGAALEAGFQLYPDLQTYYAQFT